MEVSFSKVVVYQPKLLLRNETLTWISSCKLYEIFLNVYCSDQLQAGCFLKDLCNILQFTIYGILENVQEVENDFQKMIYETVVSVYHCSTISFKYA